MGDEGQMILLSALVACLCLIGVIACVGAVDGVSHRDGGDLAGYMDNVEWARDSALQKAAQHNAAYPWESREEAALRFKSEAHASLDSLGGELLKHGEVYRISFNASLAGDYAIAHPGKGTVNIDGVLVEPAGSSVRIRGCAFDIFAYDGVTAYRTSHVATFS